MPPPSPLKVCYGLLHAYLLPNTDIGHDTRQRLIYESFPSTCSRLLNNHLEAYYLMVAPSLMASLEEEIAQNPSRVLKLLSKPNAPPYGYRSCPTTGRSARDWLEPKSRQTRLFQYQSSVFEAPNKNSPDMGLLSSLPNEILLAILLQLDLKSAIAISQLNRYARYFMATIPEIQLLVKSANETLLQFVYTRLAERTTILELIAVLRTDECVVQGCNQFSDMVFLPTCTRVCWNCIKSAVEHPYGGDLRRSQFDVFSLKTIAETSKLTVEELKDIFPTFRSIRTTKRRTNLGILRAPSLFALAEDVRRSPILCNSSLQPSAVFDSENIRPGVPVERTSLCSILSTSQMPFLDATAKETVTGVFCYGCQISQTTYFSRAFEEGILFRNDRFLKHAAACESAKELWKMVSGKEDWQGFSENEYDVHRMLWRHFKGFNT